VQGITETIEADVSALQGDVNDINGKLDTIIGIPATDDSEGTKGLIDTAAEAALAAAKTYADDMKSAAITKAGEDAEALVDVERKRIDAIDEANETRDADIDTLEQNLADEIKAREDGDKALSDKIGTIEGTVSDAIAEAITTAAGDATEKVNTLSVAVNGRIDDLESDIAAINADISDLEDVDKDLTDRLTKVEAFFGTEADREDGGYEHLNKALDTLVELQTYLNGDGETAGDLIGRVGAAENDIKDLQHEFDDADGRVTIIEAQISGINAAIDDVEAVLDGYGGKDAEGNIHTVKVDVDAAKALGQQGINDAADAKSAADNAQTTASNALSAAGAAQGTADSALDLAGIAQADVDALEGRMDTAEGAISDIQVIIASGDGKTIRDDVTALQAIVETGADRNAKLREDLTALSEAVEDEETGLAATKAIAEAAAKQAETNAGDISAIKADYVSYSATNLMAGEDIIIFNCGGANETIPNE
jgi:chromosome segregation ATPase